MPITRPEQALDFEREFHTLPGKRSLPPKPPKPPEVLQAAASFQKVGETTARGGTLQATGEGLPVVRVGPMEAPATFPLKTR